MTTMRIWGFKKVSLSDETGAFAIEGVPNGQFHIKLEKTGYVPYELPISVKDGGLACDVDTRLHYAKRGVEPCDLGTLGLRIYRVRSITLDWMLQENPTAQHFRESVSSGQVQLSSALPDDWRRGGWSCCKATFKFGSKKIDDPNPDIVIFTDTDGQLYFSQPPSQESNAFITEAVGDFNSLVEIPQGLSFGENATVKPGKTYILYTSVRGKGVPKFLAKIKVIDMK